MIYGWRHIAEMGDWREVVAEQDRLIESSGLLTETAHVFDRHASGDELECGENPTLLDMWGWANQNPGHLVWYIHTKGVSRPGDENVRLWRDYLQYFTIERWRDCVEALGSHEACGVDWTEGHDWVLDAWKGTTGCKAFLGNFWWATTECISNANPSHIRHGGRHKAEFEFIGTANPTVKVLHCSHTNLYQNAYLPDSYRNVT